MVKGLFEKEIRREEQAAQAEYYYLRRLEQAVAKRDINKVTSLVKYLGKLERRLNKYHQVVDSKLKNIDEENQNPRISFLKARLNVFANDTLKSLSKQVGNFPQMLSERSLNWQEIEEEVIRLERDIQGWEAIDESLLREGLDVMDETRAKQGIGQSIVASPEKIMDLLNGTGQFRSYSFYERCVLWNRFQRTIKSREFKDVNFSGLNFSGFCFEGFTFRRVRMDNTRFNDALLQGCFFDSVVGVGTDFTNSNFLNSVFNCCEFTSAKFIRANLDAVWIRAPSKDRSFGRNSDFNDANMSNFKASSVSFEGAKFRRACFNRSKLDHCTFLGLDLQSADFTASTIIHSSFEDANLAGASFRSADLYRADIPFQKKATFENANLNKANFTNADIIGYSFVGAKLRYSSFAGAKLKNVDLHSADVYGADFGVKEIDDINILKYTLNFNELNGLPKELQDNQGILIMESWLSEFQLKKTA